MTDKKPLTRAVDAILNTRFPVGPKMWNLLLVAVSEHILAYEGSPDPAIEVRFHDFGFSAELKSGRAFAVRMTFDFALDFQGAIGQFLAREVK